MNRAQNAEIGRRTRSTTRLAKNLLLNMAEDAKVGGNGDGGDDETVKKITSFQEAKRTYKVSYLPTLQKKDEFPLIVLAMVEDLN